MGFCQAWAASLSYPTPKLPLGELFKSLTDDFTLSRMCQEKAYDTIAAETLDCR